MFWCIILISHLLLTGGEPNLDTSYCDASTKSCAKDDNLSGTKLLFYDVNPPEGFNLRRDVYMRFAIMVAEARQKGKRLDWQLVLPPWYRLYHWRSETQLKPHPWSQFFDVKSLKTFAPVIELREVFSQTPKLEIDSLYILQNYEDPFEDGSFVDKWEISEDCEYSNEFWGYNNITAKETICVRFQGKASMLWEVLSLHPHDKKVMFTHGEIALHDNYGSKSYWNCRKSMKFNKKLVWTALNYMKTELNCDKVLCDSYISIHWRRQDFARSRIKDVPSVAGTVSQIIDMLKKHNLSATNIFVATDAPLSEFQPVEISLSNLGYKLFYYVTSHDELEDFQDGGIAIIEQIVCSHAAFFIGTHESTFSYRIQEEREILGFDSKTTFNRFCPDSGSCERPSKWRIVH